MARSTLDRIAFSKMPAAPGAEYGRSTTGGRPATAANTGERAAAENFKAPLRAAGVNPRSSARRLGQRSEPAVRSARHPVKNAG
jgi:hypothetical protein